MKLNPYSINPNKLHREMFMFTIGTVNSAFIDSEEPNFNIVEPLTENIIYSTKYNQFTTFCSPFLLYHS